ncbi:zinc finger CCCH domain-containing protein 13 [Drosophila simulans]|uniref:zinc finger CCCH domain-containing protein 13 n=1 Tax=Drosophila simulans TaxID=7240 RepID=UPI00192D0994|nr:zinc finger CCCH domain-containing protein 13 [Drosophila simulans]
MGVIYKILKQQRSMDLSLSSATRCKVQAAIKQRQQQRRLEDHMVEERDRDRERERDQEPDQDQNQVQNHIDKDKEELAEQQLQQLCRFLAENAARKKRQRFKLQQYQCNLAVDQDNDQEQMPEKQHFAAPPHEMDLEFIEQLQQSSPAKSNGGTGQAPRDSILLKIRHQIFERKRQRQRQLAELVQQRMVVWRPW